MTSSMAARSPLAKDVLSAELMGLGIKLFGSEEALDAIVANSACQPMTYASVTMQICVANGDDAKGRLPGENGDGYGLDSLWELRDPSTNMINIADVGGSYGAVTIATWKRYHGQVRSVIVEPLPVVYFLMVWSLYLNGIPVVNEDDFKKDAHLGGVIALHRGVSGTGEGQLNICYNKGSSMNSYGYMSDDPSCGGCPDGGECQNVGSVAANDVLDMLGSSDLALVKLDCEGCEMTSLPAMANGASAGRMKRLVGELHVPTADVVQLACTYNNAFYFSAFCDRGIGRVNGDEICKRCL